MEDESTPLDDERQLVLRQRRELEQKQWKLGVIDEYYHTIRGQMYLREPVLKKYTTAITTCKEQLDKAIADIEKDYFVHEKVPSCEALFSGSADEADEIALKVQEVVATHPKMLVCFYKELFQDQATVSCIIGSENTPDNIERKLIVIQNVRECVLPDLTALCLWCMTNRLYEHCRVILSTSRVTVGPSLMMSGCCTCDLTIMSQLFAKKKGLKGYYLLAFLFSAVTAPPKKQLPSQFDHGSLRIFPPTPGYPGTCFSALNDRTQAVTLPLGIFRGSSSFEVTVAARVFTCSMESLALGWQTASCQEGTVPGMDSDGQSWGVSFVTEGDAFRCTRVLRGESADMTSCNVRVPIKPEGAYKITLTLELEVGQMDLFIDGKHIGVAFVGCEFNGCAYPAVHHTGCEAHDSHPAFSVTCDPREITCKGVPPAPDPTEALIENAVRLFIKHGMVGSQGVVGTGVASRISLFPSCSADYAAYNVQPTAGQVGQRRCAMGPINFCMYLEHYHPAYCLAVSKAVPVNSRDTLGNTPLIIAAARKQFHIVQALLRVGADPCVVSANGVTALHAAMIGGSEPIALAVLDALEGMEVSKVNGLVNYLPQAYKESALLTSIRCGHTEVSRRLVTRGVQHMHPSTRGDYVVTYVCKAGPPEVAELVINSLASPEDINRREVSPTRATALHHASSRGLASIIRIILEKGADPSPKLKDGCTPLILAVRNKFDEAAHILLQYVGPQELDARDAGGNTALHFACTLGQANTAKILLQKNSTLVGIPNKLGVTPLMAALLSRNFAIAAEVASWSKADNVDAVDYKGYTALAHAAGEGCVAVLECLLDVGANPAARTNDGKSPFVLSIESGNEEAAMELLSAAHSRIDLTEHDALGTLADKAFKADMPTLFSKLCCFNVPTKYSIEDSPSPLADIEPGSPLKADPLTMRMSPHSYGPRANSIFVCQFHARHYTLSCDFVKDSSVLCAARLKHHKPFGFEESHVAYAVLAVVACLACLRPAGSFTLSDRDVLRYLMCVWCAAHDNDDTKAYNGLIRAMECGGHPLLGDPVPACSAALLRDFIYPLHEEGREMEYVEALRQGETTTHIEVSGRVLYNAEDPCLRSVLCKLVGGVGLDGVNAELVEAKNRCGMGFLHVAAVVGDVKAVREAVAAGAKINETWGDGHTPLLLALANNQKEVAEELLRNFRTSLATVTPSGCTPLAACLRFLPSVADMIVAKPSALLDIPWHGVFPIEIAIQQQVDASVLEVLAGTASSMPRQGLSLAVSAAQAQQTDLLEALLEANEAARSATTLTALLANLPNPAEHQRTARMVKQYLLSYVPSLDRNPLHAICGAQCIRVLDVMQRYIGSDHSAADRDHKRKVPLDYLEGFYEMDKSPGAIKLLKKSEPKKARRWMLNNSSKMGERCLVGVMMKMVESGMLGEGKAAAELAKEFWVCIVSVMWARRDGGMAWFEKIPHAWVKRCHPLLCIAFLHVARATGMTAGRSFCRAVSRSGGMNFSARYSMVPPGSAGSDRTTRVTPLDYFLTQLMTFRTKADQDQTEKVLELLVRFGHHRLLRLMLTRYSSALVDVPLMTRARVVQVAALHCRVDCLETMLMMDKSWFAEPSVRKNIFDSVSAGVETHVGDKEKCVQLLCNCRFPLSVKVLQYFDQGDGLDTRSTVMHDSLLHIAVINNQLDVVEALLRSDNFTLTTEPNTFNLRPLEYASKPGIWRAVRDEERSMGHVVKIPDYLINWSDLQGRAGRGGGQVPGVKQLQAALEEECLVVEVAGESVFHGYWTVSSTIAMLSKAAAVLGLKVTRLHCEIPPTYVPFLVDTDTQRIPPAQRHIAVRHQLEQADFRPFATDIPFTPFWGYPHKPYTLQLQHHTPLPPILSSQGTFMRGSRSLR